MRGNVGHIFAIGICRIAAVSGGGIRLGVLLMYESSKVEKHSFALDVYRFVGTLEERASSSVFFVEIHDVSGTQRPHEGFDALGLFLLD